VAGIWWLASYPKSGNTWLRVALASLLSGRPADINAMPFVSVIATNRALFDKALGIESADLTVEQETNLRPRAYEIWAADATQPLYCKTHDAYRRTPADEPLFPTAVTLGAVCVVRDPRAVAVSLANHLAEPIDKAIARMEDPAVGSSTSSPRLSPQLFHRPGCWSDHIDSWLSAPFPVHLVRYEDMHRDPHGAFTAVAAFLGLPSDRERIVAAVEAAAFPRLQAQERAVGFVEKPIQAAAFFREGSADGWRRTLLPEQAAHIVAANEAVMRRLGYDTAMAPLSRVLATDASSSR
jgi:aryl sulfotransferase